MKLFTYLQSKRIFGLFYWGLRIGMGLTFIASGLRKMPGVKFTTLPDTNPVGAYFSVMHDLGFYWNFIGYYQILIGILVFFNRFVVVSSMLMMPVTVNIFLISVALNMRGTPIITFAMLLGNLFLLFWHFDNYKSVLQRPMKPTKL